MGSNRLKNIGNKSWIDDRNLTLFTTTSRTISIFSTVCEDAADCYPSLHVRIFLSLLLIIFIMVAFSGNALLCGIVFRRSAMRSGINLLLANVAKTDFLLSVLHFPISIIVLNTMNWPLGDGLCKLNGFIFVFLKAEKVTVLLMISIDRYFIIVKRKDTLSPVKAKVLIACTWVISLFIAILPIIGWGQYGFRKGCIQCTMYNKKSSLGGSYIYFSTTVIVFAPILAMCFIYQRILRTVRRNGIRVQNHPPVTPTAMHKRGKYFIDYCYKTRTSTTILLLFMFFFISELPMAVLNIFAAEHGFEGTRSELFLGFLLFSYFHAVISPLLYYYRIKKFRESVSDLTSQMVTLPYCIQLSSQRRERRVHPHILYQVERIEGKIAVIT